MSLLSPLARLMYAVTACWEKQTPIPTLHPPMKITVILLAVIIGGLRPVIADITTPMGMNIYKDFAHVFMGALLVLWLLSWRNRRSLWMTLFWLLNAVEVLCVLYTKGAFDGLLSFAAQRLS